MSSIHENLKLLRQARGMTQAAVADVIGVTRQTVSSYESGRTEPDLETLTRLADLYQADIRDILYGGNRLQKKLKNFRRYVFGLSALLLIALFAHSILLWITNMFFQVPLGTVDESKRQVLEIRFALRDAADGIVRFALPIFRLGCLALLYPLLTLDHAPSFCRQAGWLFGLFVASVFVVLPWAACDKVFGYADYLLPVWNVFPTMVVVFFLSVAGGFIRGFIRRQKK